MPNQHLKQIAPEYEIDELGIKFPLQKDEETKGEEEKHELLNKFVKDTCGTKTTFSDDDNEVYLNKEDYRELVRLANEFQDGVFNRKLIIWIILN